MMPNDLAAGANPRVVPNPANCCSSQRSRLGSVSKTFRRRRGVSSCCAVVSADFIQRPGLSQHCGTNLRLSYLNPESKHAIRPSAVAVLLRITLKSFGVERNILRLLTMTPCWRPNCGEVAMACDLTSSRPARMSLDRHGIPPFASRHGQPASPLPDHHRRSWLPPSEDGFSDGACSGGDHDSPRIGAQLLSSCARTILQRAGQPPLRT